MRDNTRKILSLPMTVFGLREVAGNPYAHIFGVGMPVLFALLITKIALDQTGGIAASVTATTIYLGMGSMIPMAVIMIGYAVSYAEQLAKGIPQRMQLFGIKSSTLFCSRAAAELLFITASFLLFFLTGIVFYQIKKPSAAGAAGYILCMFVFSMICLSLAHGIACLCRNFGKTYCISMIMYFAFMILGGMMGIQYEDLPKGLQVLAKLLPVMYFNRDFYKIWIGESYDYVPLIQSFLFVGAVSGIILFTALRRPQKIRSRE